MCVNKTESTEIINAPPQRIVQRVDRNTHIVVLLSMSSVISKKTENHCIDLFLFGVSVLAVARIDLPNE